MRFPTESYVCKGTPCSASATLPYQGFSQSGVQKDMATTLTGSDARQGGQPLPLYLRIKSHIADRIRQGAWPEGLKIPSENQLVAELKVSRMTVNRALRELTDEGYLARVQGVGTFVKGNPSSSNIVALRDIAEDIRQRGHQYRAIVEERTTVRANGELMRQFALAQPVILQHVVIVHCEDELPVQVESRWCHPALFPQFLEQDFRQQTPEIYLSLVRMPDETECTITATLPTAEQQRLLIIEHDDPCILVERREWYGGVVGSFVRQCSAGSRYRWQSRTRSGRP